MKSIVPFYMKTIELKTVDGEFFMVFTLRKWGTPFFYVHAVYLIIADYYASTVERFQNAFRFPRY